MTISLPYTLPLTALPIWSPSSLPSSRTHPLLATGSVSGALDASFSSDSFLEIYSPFADTPSSSSAAKEQQTDDWGLGEGIGPGSSSSGGGANGDGGEKLEPLSKTSVGSRFCRLAWGSAGTKKLGLLAGAFENGDVSVWDPKKLIHGNGDESKAIVAKFDDHKGPVKGLDFNKTQENYLASGGPNGEIFIHDLLSPSSKPFTPGTRSRSIEDVTCLEWNNWVNNILATGSNTSYTVVWDLKSKREVTALSYTPPNAVSGLGAGGWGGLGGGQKGGVSSVRWDPDTPTKLVTASDDDSNPIIMLWDLRNWKEPEKILQSHTKGILSLSWCFSDSSLLLSSGKDGRTICWNVRTGEIVAETTPSSNWSYDVSFSPTHPSLFTTSSLDSNLTLRRLQDTSTPSSLPPPPTHDSADLFAAAISANAANYPTKSLSHHPKWLARPSSVSFGFGGKLVTIGGGGKEVVIKNVVGEPEVVERALRLDVAVGAGGSEGLGGGLAVFCAERGEEVGGDEGESWKLLGNMFEGGREGRKEMVKSLGFDREELRGKVEGVVRGLVEKREGEGGTPRVSFKVGGSEGTSSEGEGAVGSEFSASTKREAESEVTEPSLFGDDNPTLGGGQAAVDFYSQIGSGRLGALPDHLFSAGPNSSVAATVGSASSIASLSFPSKSTPFQIYPSSTTEVERLMTRALMVGDFESAVELAVASDKFADAILLACQGGEELLKKTQKIYFEREIGKAPYLRVFQSVIEGDLVDLVSNAELEDWQEIFVVLATFAKSEEEFGKLVGELGTRLEENSGFVKRELGVEKAKVWRKNAILCYLAAGKLEKVVGIWLVQMMEEEEEFAKENGGKSTLATVKFDARAKALQGFVEKVTVFQHAVGYVDADLSTGSTNEDGTSRSYKLAPLYERYVEYAELLASQGLVSIALKFIAQTPADFEGLKTDSISPSLTRHRLELASGKRAVPVWNGGAKITAPVVAQATSFAPVSNQLQPQPQQGGYQYPTQEAYGRRYNEPPVASTTSSSRYGNGTTSAYLPPPTGPTNDHDDPYAPYAPKQPSPYGVPPSSNPYQQQSQPTFQPPPPPQPHQQPSPYTANPTPYQPSQSFIPAPPAIRENSPNFAPRAPVNAPPPPRAKPEVQWNDAPILAARKSTPLVQPSKQQAITSPFPMGQQQSQQGYGQPPPLQPQGGYAAPPPPMGMGGQGQHQPPPPPPSRGGNRTPAPVAPPPRFQPAPPVPTMSPPPQAGQPQPSRAFPPPPPPPGPRGPVQQQPPQPPHLANQNNFPRGAPTPPPNANFARPPAPPAPSPYAAPPPVQHQSSSQGRPNGPPQPFAGQPQQPQQSAPPPPGPYGPPTTSAPSPYNPPPGSQRPGPPPSFNGGQPPRPAQSSPAPPPAPVRAEPPKAKYPAGDRSHIPDASKPIFNVLSNQIKRLREVTPPQQMKVINDTEKRLNILFDALNCGTLAEPAHSRVLEICKAIEARDQQQALELHLAMLTQGSGDVSSFQAALKLVIQRMAI